MGAAGIGQGLQIGAAAGIEALFAFPLANRIQLLADEGLGFDPDRLGEGGGGGENKIGQTHLRPDLITRRMFIMFIIWREAAILNPPDRLRCRSF